MESVKGRNPSIDVFRYVCAVLVIAIHTGPFEEINPTLGYIATDVIPRIGVPFFFIVSGYFYIRKLQNGEKPFRQYFKRLITIYFVWSCLYFLIEFMQWGHADPRGFIVNCITTFVYYGSSYHFWFFPALIFALCFTTFLWRLGGRRILIPLSIVLYTVGVLGCAYYNVFQNIPLLGQFFAHPQFDNIRRILLMGFPFFSGGYIVLKSKEKISKQQGLRLWIVSLMIWILEIVVVVNMQYQRSIVLTFGLYPLVLSTLTVLVQNPLPKLQGISDTSRKLANFTYYAHPALILLINFVGGVQAYGNQRVPNTALFLLTTISTFFAGLLICKLNNPTLDKLIS